MVGGSMDVGGVGRLFHYLSSFFQKKKERAHHFGSKLKNKKVCWPPGKKGIMKKRRNFLFIFIFIFLFACQKSNRGLFHIKTIIMTFFTFGLSRDGFAIASKDSSSLPLIFFPCGWVEYINGNCTV